MLRMNALTMRTQHSKERLRKTESAPFEYGMCRGLFSYGLLIRSFLGRGMWSVGVGFFRTCPKRNFRAQMHWFTVLVPHPEDEGHIAQYLLHVDRSLIHPVITDLNAGGFVYR